jgi:hypothetical protein
MFALALAIGVNSAIFNVGRTVVMRLDYVMAVDGRSNYCEPVSKDRR